MHASNHAPVSASVSEPRDRMNGVYLLEWTFSPADYFEEAVEFPSDLCTIHVENGKAEARISSYSRLSEARAIARSMIEGYLLYLHNKAP